MLAENQSSAGVMSGIYASSRKRVEVALNQNLGNRMTQELAVGLFMLIDECFRQIVEAMQQPPDEVPESPGLTSSEE